jgi:TPR repeat protein
MKIFGIVVITICGIVFCIAVLTFRIVPCSAEYFDLKDVEIRYLTQRAIKSNDAEAAMRLSNYYFFTKGDIEEAHRWTKLAADLGNVASMKDLNFLDELLMESKQKHSAE